MAKTRYTRTEPKGLLYRADFLSEQEQETLTPVVEAMDYGDVRMHGQASKREVRHFGYLYGYESCAQGSTDPLPARYVARTE